MGKDKSPKMADTESVSLPTELSTAFALYGFFPSHTSSEIPEEYEKEDTRFELTIHSWPQPIGLSGMRDHRGSSTEGYIPHTAPPKASGDCSHIRNAFEKER